MANLLIFFISADDAAVSYETFDRVVELVQAAGPGALLAKVDIENAFRIIPIHPADRYLLGFAIGDDFYYDRCLPMGCRSSCAIFESFSSALQWVAMNKLSIPAVTHILDDFIFIGPANTRVTSLSLESFLLLCKDCGIPIKTSKTVLPSTCVIAHGIEIDTKSMEARLPEEKIEKAQTLLRSFMAKRKVTLKELQSLIGLLNFACRVIRPGRAFLRRMINLTCAFSNPTHHISINKEAKADMAAWLTFLSSYNGITVFPETDVSDSELLNLYSDAAGSLGFSTVFGAKWFADHWPQEMAPLHITFKEFLPITLMVEIWGPFFKNKRILFHCDNSAVVEIVNKQSCKEPHTMSLVRRFVMASLQFNFIFKAKHIPGKTNIVADKLSRFQFQEARQLAPWLETSPTQVPSHLLYISSNSTQPS
jgi:hypothetical protein